MDVRPRNALRFSAAVTSVSALLLIAAAPALAADPGANSSAFGIKATVLSGAVNVPPTPTSTFPPGGTTHLANVDLGALGTVGASNATTAGDSTAGTSSATGSVANVALLKNALTGFPAVSADLISATCSDTAPADPTGSSTFTNASVGGTAIVDVKPAPNTKLLNLGPLLVVTLNEQTLSNGVLTVNALHVQLGPILNGQASLADVIIGQAVCGPNTAPLATPAFSFQDLWPVLGALAIVALIGYGSVAGVRRFRSAV
ncbi:MAG: hypothetical protein ACR2LX_05850 [Jatrophihabitans sp.]